MRPGQSATKSKASLQGRLASCPLVLFNYYTHIILYKEYLVNSDTDLDVVELWSGVESIVFAARAARASRAASHRGHRHLQEEVLTSTGLLASLIRMDSYSNIFLVWNDLCHALQLICRLCRGGLLWMAPTC